MAIKILVVDDSAFMRQLITKMLEGDAELDVVAFARDGIDALNKIGLYQPNVITLDVEMPNMDGLQCLAKIMEQHPMPVLMLSSLTKAGAEPTIKALELGAVDYITKPSTTDATLINQLREELIQKVKAAAKIRPNNLKRVLPQSDFFAIPKPHLEIAPKIQNRTQLELVAIGSSTGGPRALYYVLPQIPADFPLGIIIAQHMPKEFTGIFAQRLNSLCQVEVAEAKDGDRIVPGKVLIAPSGKQTMIVRENEKLIVKTSNEPNLLYKPSVDYLFKSISQSSQGRVLSVILTGMGGDGAIGMKEMRDLGARTIAEAEESCVVFGMPRVAIEMGAAEYVESLPNILPRIFKIIMQSDLHELKSGFDEGIYR